MPTLNLSLPEELKSYIKEKAAEMNMTVSEIFVNYIKQIKDTESKEKQSFKLTPEQKEKLKIAKRLAGSIPVKDDINIDEIKLQYLIDKHLKDD
ncbi:MAG: hypothetical protein GXO86_03235 [Chlorobi bacterium]|nr:hypothetical protein [Chlorobiota bacterium]